MWCGVVRCGVVRCFTYVFVSVYFSVYVCVCVCGVWSVCVRLRLFWSMSAPNEGSTHAPLDRLLASADGIMHMFAFVPGSDNLVFTVQVRPRARTYYCYDNQEIWGLICINWLACWLVFVLIDETLWVDQSVSRLICRSVTNACHPGRMTAVWSGSTCANRASHA